MIDNLPGSETENILKKINNIIIESNKLENQIRKVRIEAKSYKLRVFNRILAILSIMLLLLLPFFLSLNTNSIFLYKTTRKIFKIVKKEKNTQLNYVYEDKYRKLEEFMNDTETNLVYYEKIIYDYSQNKKSKYEAKSILDFLDEYKQFRRLIKQYLKGNRTYDSLLTLEAKSRILDSRIESIKRYFLKNKRWKKK